METEGFVTRSRHTGADGVHGSLADFSIHTHRLKDTELFILKNNSLQLTHRRLAKCSLGTTMHENAALLHQPLLAPTFLVMLQSKYPLLCTFLINDAILIQAWRRVGAARRRVGC